METTGILGKASPTSLKVARDPVSFCCSCGRLSFFRITGSQIGPKVVLGRPR